MGDTKNFDYSTKIDEKKMVIFVIHNLNLSGSYPVSSGRMYKVYTNKPLYCIKKVSKWIKYKSIYIHDFRLQI